MGEVAGAAAAPVVERVSDQKGGGQHMKTIALASSLLFLAVAGQARNTGPVDTAARSAGERDPFYCQQPGEDRWWAYNAMSYYHTEMADGIPSNLNGEGVADHWNAAERSECECSP